MFVDCIDPINFTDHEPISRLLSTQQLQAIQKKTENDGQSSGARKLLEFLKMKWSQWFPAVLETLKIPSLKLSHLEPRFRQEKERVDKEWRKEWRLKIANRSASDVTLDFPTQDSSAAAMGPLAAGVPPSDFRLPVADTDSELQRDHCAADRPERDPPKSPQELPPTDIPGPDDGATSGAAASEETEAEHPQFFLEQPPDEAENYTDAQSTIPVSASTYSQLQPTPPDSLTPYNSLQTPMQNLSVQPAASSLQTDAELEARQEEERGTVPGQEQRTVPEQERRTVPEQEQGTVPEQATTGQQARAEEPVRRRFTTREEHPSLVNAISSDVRKDFGGRFVAQELCTLPGWLAFTEEAEVMELLKPKVQEEGVYAIWYWALAKRPTICVTHNRKLVTFVVHKSTSQRPSFYVNKRQKRSHSLKETVQFHLENGVQYTSQDNQEINVTLTTPAT